MTNMTSDSQSKTAFDQQRSRLPRLAWLLIPAAALVLVLLAAAATAMFMAVGGDVIRKSDDGISWSPVTNPLPSSNVIQTVATDGNAWMIGGLQPGPGGANVPLIVTGSPDGITWTKQVVAAPAVAYSQFDGVWGDGTQWIAVGSRPSHPIIGVGSADGTTWTQPSVYDEPQTGNNYLWAVAGSGGTIVAVGHFGQGCNGGGCDGGAIYTYNGVAWTTQQAVFTSQAEYPPYGYNWGVGFTGVATNGNIWVAVAGSGDVYTSTNPAATSPTWTQRGPLGARFGDITWGDNQFIAVGGTMNGVKSVWTSPDGITWTGQPNAPKTDLRAVGYDQCRWAAAGKNGNIFTSDDDGVTWILRPSGTNFVLAHLAAKPCTTQCSTTTPTVASGAPVTFKAVGPSPGYTWVASAGASTMSFSGNPFTTSWTAGGSHSVTVTDAKGVTYTCYVTVTAPPPAPTCSASGPILTGTSTTITVSGGVGPFTWSGGDNPASGSGAGPFSTQYTTPGTKTIGITDSESPTKSASCTVTVNDPPPLSCAPGSSFFLPGDPAGIAITGGTPNYAWSGGGTPATGTTAAFSFSTKYASAGTYTLTVKDTSYVPQTATCNVTIGCGDVKPPTSAFSASPTTAHPGEQVDFVDASVAGRKCAPVVGWIWNFGDGNTASQSKPIHVFGDVGTYKVCLVAKDSADLVGKSACLDINVIAASAGPSGGSGTATAPQDDPPSPPKSTAPPSDSFLAVDAGLAQTVLPGSQVALHASTPGTNGASFHWLQTAGSNVALNGADSASLSFTAPATDGAVLYFEVDAVAGSRHGLDGVMVTVAAQPTAPVVTVPPRATATVGDVVILQGSAISDGPSAIHWSQWDGPAVQLVNPISDKSSFTPTQAGTYTFAMEASDGQRSGVGVETITVLAHPAAVHPGAAPDASAPTIEGSSPVGEKSMSSAPSVASNGWLWTALSLTLVGLDVATIAVYRKRRRTRKAVVPANEGN